MRLVSGMCLGHVVGANRSATLAETTVARGYWRES